MELVSGTGGRSWSLWATAVLGRSVSRSGTSLIFAILPSLLLIYSMSRSFQACFHRLSSNNIINNGRTSLLLNESVAAGKGQEPPLAWPCGEGRQRFSRGHQLLLDFLWRQTQAVCVGMDYLSLMSIRKRSFSSAPQNTHHLCWFSWAIRERYCNVVENMYCSRNTAVFFTESWENQICPFWYGKSILGVWDGWRTSSYFSGFMSFWSETFRCFCWFMAHSQRAEELCILVHTCPFNFHHKMNSPTIYIIKIWGYDHHLLIFADLVLVMPFPADKAGMFK